MKTYADIWDFINETFPKKRRSDLQKKPTQIQDDIDYNDDVFAEKLEAIMKGEGEEEEKGKKKKAKSPKNEESDEE